MEVHPYHVGIVWHDRRWPVALPGLGPRTTGTYTMCSLCPTGTWVRYADIPFCFDCAGDPASAHFRWYGLWLERLWGLRARGAKADPTEIEEAHQHVMKFIDNIGEPKATTLRRQQGTSWYESTCFCPHCGRRGVFHEETP
jgi:hypothetical protein